MYKNYDNKIYTKLDTKVSTNEENDENLPANFQKPISGKIEDSVCELFNDTEDISRISTNVICGDGINDFKLEDNENVPSPSPSAEFCDAECGEPATSQLLKIDFTISSDDTEFSQQKCCDFWKFIYTVPDLQNMMIVPETLTSAEDRTSNQTISSSGQASITPRSTAVEALQKAADGPVPSSFAAKEASMCRHQDFPDYCYGSCVKLDKNFTEKRKSLIGKGDGRLPTIDVQPSRKNFLTRLCAQMNAWDLEHPKSFDPPRVPPLTSEYESEQSLTSSVTTSRFCPDEVTCVTCQPKPVLDMEGIVKKEE